MIIGGISAWKAPIFGFFERITEAVMAVNYNDTIRAEILAPAGTYECFRAAVNAGADAVYLGGSMFGARAFAENFDEDELLKAIKTAHLYGRKVYLTVNTLLRNVELVKLTDYIRPYYEAGLDAVIVQDYGVFSVLRDNFPGLALHASTQMTITGRYGAKLLKDMGADRVVTARELSAAEIKDIHDNVDVEIESFVHGALCYCYSGQCLLSSMIGGRSGNRGRCAQPCRLLYSIDGGNPSYLLSPKDMCTIESVPDILEAGVYSLKIEGRMKSPEYVAGVTAAYRKYVDMYLERGREGFHVDKNDIKNLMDLYNRGGFCKGYYYAHNDKNMMTFDRPNHRGIAVGTYKNGKLVLTEAVNSGDVLEFCDGSEYTVPSAKKDGKLPLPKGFARNVKNSSTVYRTRNNALLAEIRQRYIDNDVKLAVRMNAYLRTGEQARLTVGILQAGTDNNGCKEVTVYGDVLESSDKHPATRADVLKQLKKLGTTVFTCEDKDIVTDISDNPFVPVKLLNDLRRNALEKLEGMITAAEKNTERGMDAHGRDAAMRVEQHTDGTSIGKVRSSTFNVLVMTEKQLSAVLKMCGREAAVSVVYISTELAGIDGVLRMKGMIDGFNEKNPESRLTAYLAMPYIFRKNAALMYDARLEDIKRAGFDGMLIRSPEELMYVKVKGLYELYHGNITADYNMYTYNKEAVSEYEALGLYSFTLSEELNAGQLRGLLRSVKGEKIYTEKLVYGYVPLMVTAGCTLKYTSKDKPCGRAGVYSLKDRKGKSLCAINSCHYCYNLIYNSVPEFLLDKLGELKDMGVDGMRMAFSVENEDETEKVLALAVRAIKGDETMAGHGADGYTRGHYNRGVD